MISTLRRNIDYDLCVKVLLNYCDDENISLWQLSQQSGIDYSALRRFLFKGTVNSHYAFKIISFVIKLKGGVIFYEDFQNH